MTYYDVILLYWLFLDTKNNKKWFPHLSYTFRLGHESDTNKRYLDIEFVLWLLEEYPFWYHENNVDSFKATPPVDVNG